MKSVVVRVYGSDYNVRADSDDGHVRQVAETVDRRMREIDSQYPQGSSTRTAVLACMNIVEDHLAGQRQQSERTCRAVRMLIDKLDRVIGSG